MSTLSAITLAVLAAVSLVAAYLLGRRSQSPPVDAARPGANASRPSGITVTPSTPLDGGARRATPVSTAPLPPTTTAPATAPARPLAAVASWGYQLQNLKIREAAASPFDLLVVDTTRDGDEATALTPADIARLRRKPDGTRRIVLAYLSIGEAESYRSYWRAEWKRTRPEWLLGENPDWPGNHAVCFWHRDWQALMLGSDDAALDRILAAGFDGVYLDKCDVYEDLREHFKQVAKTRPHLEADMVAFVARLSAYAKAKRPGFHVVMQNAEELVERKGLLDAIDGIAKEELLFGQDAPERRNGAEDVKDTTANLVRAQRAGKSVFCVEYLANPAKIAEARTFIEGQGFVCYIAAKDRELDRLGV